MDILGCCDMPHRNINTKDTRKTLRASDFSCAEVTTLRNKQIIYRTINKMLMYIHSSGKVKTN